MRIIKQPTNIAQNFGQWKAATIVRIYVPGEYGTTAEVITLGEPVRTVHSTGKAWDTPVHDMNSDPHRSTHAPGR